MPPQPPTKGPRRPNRIGKYEVLAHIATGGMGTVYRARNSETGQEVALKVLAPGMASKPAMLERFRREARSAEKLSDENIVTLYEFGEADGTYFLAMEFVPGIDLNEYVRRKGRLDPEEARQIVMQVCRALIHAHEQNIVHRDIKPSNLLLTEKYGRPLVKLTDLGLARESSSEEFRVTRAGTTVGTLDYMAPEQARDSSLADTRSDLYSLGSTWYFLLTGKPPFPKGGLAERLYKIMNDEPPDVRRVNPRVSEGTVEVLSRLLAKDPADRYQTPRDLLRDLVAIEGGGRPHTTHQALQDLAEEEGPVSSSRTKVRSTAPRTRKLRRPTPSRQWLWVALGGGAAVIAVLLLVLILVYRHRHPPSEQAGTGPSSSSPGPALPPVQPPGTSPGPLVIPKGPPDQGGPGPVPRVNPAPKPRWRPLEESPIPIDVLALRKEMEGSWEGVGAVPANAPVLRVCRDPAGAAEKSYSSLAEACAAAPSGTQPCVVEVADNGPLFETGVALTGRSLVVRAARGYRPLLVWDVQKALAPSRTGGGGQPASGPAFLDVRNGNLTLEGVNVAVRWPEAAATSAPQGERSAPALLRVEGGTLSATDCVFSAMVRQPEGMVLAQVRSEQPGKGNCRLMRCYARGRHLVALDLDAPGGQVRLDGCLVAGGELPLLRVRADAARGASLRVLRSTLVCGKTLLVVTPARDTDHDPSLDWLSWDALLSRSGGETGSALLDLAGGAGTANMHWRAANCLYAGWEKLLAGKTIIPSDNLRQWHLQWGQVAGDRAEHSPWPAASFTTLAEVPPTLYTPGGDVAFASSVNPDAPLGCPLDALPPSRDNWLGLTYERVELPPLEVLDDSTPPEIPTPGDRLYHGEQLVLGEQDLGAYLQQVQQRSRLAPRVVLHLIGTGEHVTSPIRVKGSSLVLYFQPPPEGAEPLTLVLSGRESAGSDGLVEVKGRGLDIINGNLRLPDFPSAQLPPYLLKVEGGDLRLYHTRLYGPQQNVPDEFRALVCLQGSTQTAVDRARSASVNECVLVSGGQAVRIEGVGARLEVRRSLIVAGTNALRLALGPDCKDRANVHCVLKSTTVAARKAVALLEDVPTAGWVREPAVVQTRDSAFLNPFLGPVSGRPNRAGLLLYEGDALAHGLVIWQSDNDGYDSRLSFRVAPAASISVKAQGPEVWQRLWGSPGVQDPHTLRLTHTLGTTGRWQLRRLAVPGGQGANLNRLGLSPAR